MYDMHALYDVAARRCVEAGLPARAYSIGELADDRCALVLDEGMWLGSYAERGFVAEHFRILRFEEAIERFVEWVAEVEASTHASAEATREQMRLIGETRT